MTTASQQSARKSGWIPWVFVGIFAVFLVANGIMVYFASVTWTGVETENAYERGLDYNRTLAAVRDQEALGWQVAVDVRPVGQQEAQVEVALSDRNGRAVAARRVRARLNRPTHTGYDTEADLRDLGAGHYSGTIALPLPGQWDLEVLVEHAGRTASNNTPRGLEARWLNKRLRRFSGVTPLRFRRWPKGPLATTSAPSSRRCRRAAVGSIS